MIGDLQFVFVCKDSRESALWVLRQSKSSKTLTDFPVVTRQKGSADTTESFNRRENSSTTRRREEDWTRRERERRREKRRGDKKREEDERTRG